MSGSWDSSRRRETLLVLAAVLALGLGPASVSARTYARATVQDDSGQVVGRVRISSDGVEVTRLRGDSSSVSVTDDDDTDIVVDTRGAGLVRLFSDAHVRAGERIDGDVVAVFGSVQVEGEVTGNAVAVFGSLDLGPQASVGEDAVSVLGGLRTQDGARVAGQSVDIGFLPLTLGLPALPVVLATILLGWLISLFFGWMFSILFPDQLHRVAQTASRRTAASFALGVFSGPLAVVLTVLLMVTVIGIVIAVLMPFVAVVVVYAGQLAAAYLLGCKLLRRQPGSGSPLGPIAAANTFVAVIFVISAVLWTSSGVMRTAALFFDLVGVVMLASLSAIGTGAFILSRFGAAPRANAASPGHARGPAIEPGAPAAPVA